MPSKLLTVDELSAYLKIPKPTVYYLAQTGRIPASKVGRHWRFEEKEIKKWLKEQQVAYRIKREKK
ncbi:MAG: helix-turn-helix domain-containing protein [Elusimicrobiota bacterium]|nr:helix-turn-helix domain-containing protein [Elusimicrobiota bacterium]MDH5661438.1 helix-turn-helix domain-containing protein [Elusimicrobiota bacterium]